MLLVVGGYFTWSTGEEVRRNVKMRLKKSCAWGIANDEVANPGTRNAKLFILQEVRDYKRKREARFKEKQRRLGGAERSRSLGEALKGRRAEEK